jgi:hypothetical protein
MRAGRLSILGLLLAALPTVVGAQESRLVGRLPDAARASVDSIIESARGRGLPVEPLVDRALEGAAMGAAPGIIVGAIRRLHDELIVVRGAFGGSATTAELTAGVSALRAGATSQDLARLRRLRPGRPLTVAAAVLADLAAAGVPADTAVGAVMVLARDADDADYIAFRRNVQRDIEQGASPAAALAIRVRGALAEADAPSIGSGTPPPPRPKQKP